MDERLQKIVDEAQLEFGLDAYRLERYGIYKQRDSKGQAYYQFNMEWFPKDADEAMEDDMNPEGRQALITICKKNVLKVLFLFKVNPIQRKRISYRKHLKKSLRGLNSKLGGHFQKT